MKIEHAFLLIFIFLNASTMHASWAQNIACRVISLFYQSKTEMTAAQVKEFEALLKIDPYIALDQLKTKKFPLADHHAIAITLMGEISLKIEHELTTQGNTREANKLYNRLISTLNQLDLDEAILSSLAHNFLIKEPFHPLVRKNGYAGKRAFARSMARSIQYSIASHAQSKIGGRSWKILWLDPYLRDIFIHTPRKMIVAALLLAATAYAQHYVVTLPQRDIQTAEKLIADGRAVMFRFFGYESLGWGIYLNMDGVRSTLGQRFTDLEDKLNLLKKNNSSITKIIETEDEIIRLLVDELNGDYTQWIMKSEDELHITLAASSLLKSCGSNARGICRHKAVAMVGILNATGIPTKLEWGALKNSSYSHAWARLTEREVLVDPTWNRIMDPAEYHEKYLLGGKPSEHEHHNKWRIFSSDPMIPYPEGIESF
jgi:hypothetical protein